jgi:16S rRNA C1402 (ribose-2'-O) methylase RsmI
VFPQQKKKIKGESVFIISGTPDKPPLSKEEIEVILRQYKLTGEISLKDAVKDVTNEYNLSRSKVYNLALKIWQ